MADTTRNAANTSSPSADPAKVPAETLPYEKSAGERLQAAVNRVQASSANDKEEDLWEGGYSGKAMVGTWLLCIVVSIGLVVLRTFVPDIPTMIIIAVVAAIWVVAILVYAYRRLGIHYRLTTQRFIHQSGILSRVTDRIEVIDIDDVTYAQGPVQRIFGVGTIRLTSSDRTHPALTMLGIADVQHVSGLIDDIRRKERRRRSLHIEQV